MKKSILLILGLLLLVGCDGVTLVSNKSQANETQMNESDDINLSTVSNIQAYLNSTSNYQLVSSQMETEESVQDYINSGKEFQLTPLEKIESDNVVIQYGENNQTISIPKSELYVLSDTDDTQIFVTFNGGDQYEVLENYSGLIFNHDTLKIPTGFTNIQLESVTSTSLENDISKALEHIGINNPTFDSTQNKVEYKTALKNNDKLIECIIDSKMPPETFVIDESNTFDLALVDVRSSIACSIGENANKTTYQLSISASEAEAENNTTSTENATEDSSTENSALANTNIKLTQRITNSISHQALINTRVSNDSISINDLNITAILTDTQTDNGYVRSSYNSNSVSEGEERLFKIQNIDVRLADERRFNLSYKVENIKTKESVIIDANLVVTVFGDYTDVTGGTTQNANSDQLSTDNITIRMNEATADTTHYNTVDITINRPAEYDLVCEIYYNGGLTNYKSDTKTLTVNADTNYRLQFIVYNLEIRTYMYTLKLKITDKYTNESVTIEGASFYVR